MSSEIWLPALVVLLTGLVLGALLALRLRGSGGGKQKDREPNLGLEIRDLEERRDDLYRRLRAAEEERLSEDETAALEQAAAVTLMELDELRATHPEPAAAPAADTAADREADSTRADTAPATAAPSGRGRPMLVGMLSGAAMMLLIALLVYWAMRDAKPRQPETMPTSASVEDPRSPPPIEVSAELADQISELQQRLVTDPQDWMARKQLALSYVAAGQFFEAFSEASQILQQFPGDPDGLLVHGIVRLTMGQAEQSLDLLDQVLAQHPSHRQAMIYRGLALYQLGRVQQAIDTWEMGVSMAPEGDPELEQLIDMARSGGPPPTASPSSSVPPPAARPDNPPAATNQPIDPETFAVHVEIDTTTASPPQATLFVYLLPAEGGPPVAARRVAAPRFPVDLALAASDSMMGAELPETGLLVARLDADGNVATSSPTDLQRESIARKGERVSLTLSEIR